MQQRQAQAGQQAENSTEPSATVSGAADPKEAADKVTLEAVCAMVEEANKLDVDEGLRVKLRDAAMAGFSWHTTAALLLSVQPYDLVPILVYNLYLPTYSWLSLEYL